MPPQLSQCLCMANVSASYNDENMVLMRLVALSCTVLRPVNKQITTWPLMQALLERSGAPVLR